MAGNSSIQASVVIVTRNRAVRLGKILEQLAAQRGSRLESAEVIVVDNGSKDDTQRVLERQRSGFPWQLKSLIFPAPGKSGALNEGIKAAEGEFVLFTDDDTVLPPNWIQRYVETFESSTVDGIGGPVYPVWSVQKPEWLPGPAIHHLGMLDYGKQNYFVEWNEPFIRQNAGYRRSVFDKAGMFNPEAPGGAEDIDFFYRAREAGLTMLYLHDVKVGHSLDEESCRKKRIRRRLVREGCSMAYGFRKQRNDRNGIPMMLWGIKMLLLTHLEFFIALLMYKRREMKWQWYRRYLYAGVIGYGVRNLLTRSRTELKKSVAV